MDKEKLYEDRMKLKIQVNSYKDENIKLKTKILILEKELQDREKLVENAMTADTTGSKGSSIILK